MKPVRRERPEGCEKRIETGSGYSGRGYWFAECRCGWGGDPRFSREEAVADAERHLLQDKGEDGDG